MNQDVILVVMPYATMDLPSLGSSILKSALKEANISVKVMYANLFFAEKIGTRIYDIMAKNLSHSLAGEWTFAEAVYSEFKPSHEEYFEYIREELDIFEPMLKSLKSRLTLEELLWKLRKQTAGFVDEIAHKILKANPRIVGCSSVFQQHCPSLALLKRIKELNPDVVTLIGGANCESIMGVTTHKESPWVDYVVSGEADIILPQLCKKIFKKSSDLTLEELPFGVIGPVHRMQKAYKKLEKSPPRARVENLKDSPIPDFQDYFETLNSLSISYWIKYGIPMETSRGCWWGEKQHCKFCGLNGDSLKYRSKDTLRVVEEFDLLYQKYKVKKMLIVDNILDMKYFKEVIPELINREEKLDIFFETKANLNYNQLKLLADAGIRWIQPGIEALDDTLLKMLRKGTTTYQNLQLLKWAQEFGINVQWMHLYNIPGEDDDIFLKLAEWLPTIFHLQPPKWLSAILYNRFSTYHQHPEEYNLNLTYDRSYNYIYPWSKESLENYAYLFNDYTNKKDGLYTGEQTKFQRPGLKALQNVYQKWRNEWKGFWYDLGGEDKETPKLVIKEVDNELEITDTRPCAINEKHYLKDLDRIVYKICDQAHKISGILTILKKDYNYSYCKEEIELILIKLCEKKLMLKLNDRYLSLAVRTPKRPIAAMADYPGGRLLSFSEARQKELLKIAESQLIIG